MKSKILFQQKARINSKNPSDGRWVRATLVDHAPVPGYSRHAHVLTVSVDDGDMRTYYEARTLLPFQADALSIRAAIEAYDAAFSQTIIEMGDASLLNDSDEVTA